MLILGYFITFLRIKTKYLSKSIFLRKILAKHSATIYTTEHYCMNTEASILETIVENSLEGLLIVENQQIIHINSRLKDMFYFLDSLQKGKHIGEALPFLDTTALELLWRGEQVSPQAVQSYRHNVQMPRVYFEWSASPIRQEIGQAPRAIFHFKDVSELWSKDKSLTKKRLKDALKAFDFSNDRLRSIINSSPNLIAAIDTNFRFTLFNERFKEVFERYSSCKITIGVSYLDCLQHLPEEQAKARNYWERALVGEDYTVVEPIKYEDKVFYAELHFSLVQDREGEVIGASVMMRNVTERKKAEDLLKASENRFRRIFSEAAVGFAIFDAEHGKFLQVNPAFCQMLGYAQSELLRFKFTQITHPEDAEKVQNALKSLKNGETKSFRGDKRMYNKAGQEIWGSISITLLDLSFYPREVGLAIVENITERKIAKERLIESEARNKALIEAFPDMIFQLDHFGRLTDFNLKEKDSFVNFIKRQINKPIEEMPLPTEVQQEVKRLLEQTIETGTIQIYEVEIPTRTELRNYEARFVRSGENKVVVIVRDISLIRAEERQIKELLDNKLRLNQHLEDRNQALAQKEEELTKTNEKLIAQYENLAETTKELRNSRNKLKQALKELEERNFELDQFVHKTSHDLRSPLNSILGIINLVKLEPNPNLFREYLQRIEGRVVRLDDFIQSMLNYSRNNRSELAIEPINFEEIIEQCLDDLKFYKNINQIEKNWRIEGNGSTFYSDFLRVKIIFTNLISNAIKYQDFDKTQRFININLKIQSEQVLITFEDNGIGIEPMYLKNLFQMFYRATEASEGSGLGLYIVKQTIDKLKGDISLQSEGHQQGLKVQVMLPNLKR